MTNLPPRITNDPRVNAGTATGYLARADVQKSERIQVPALLVRFKMGWELTSSSDALERRVEPSTLPKYGERTSFHERLALLKEANEQKKESMEKKWIHLLSVVGQMKRANGSVGKGKWWFGTAMDFFSGNNHPLPSLLIHSLKAILFHPRAAKSAL
jgi:hypothetical protein